MAGRYWYLDPRQLSKPPPYDESHIRDFIKGNFKDLGVEDPRYLLQDGVDTGHVLEESSTCFGALSFLGFKSGNQINVPYIRVGPDAQCDTVWELLCDVWKMPRPKMVISVAAAGDLEDLTISAPVRRKLQRALLNVVTKTDAWLLTSGLGRGAAGLVGEAVHDYQQQLMHQGMDGPQITLLGIGDWGIVNNKEALTKKQEGDFDAKYMREQLKDMKTTRPLESNHTHLLFVDGGGVEKFRAELESFIYKQDIPETQGLHVPLVKLVLAGTAIDTMRMAWQAANDDLLAILIESTDGISNLVYQCRGLQGDVSLAKQSARGTWTKEDEELLLGFHRDNHDPYPGYVRLIEEKDSVSVMEKCIIEDLLEAHSHEIMSNGDVRYNWEKMDVALVWNQPDIARQHVLNAGNRTALKGLGFNKHLLRALLQRNTDFVQLLIKHTVWSRQNDDMSGMTDQELLEELYADEARILCFRNEEEQTKAKTPQERLAKVARAIRPFVDDQPNKDTYGELKVDILVKDLFFWAIFLNQTEFVRIFWEVYKDHIGGALVAGSLFKALSEMARKNEELDLAQDLSRSSKVWEQVAVDVLTECYTLHPERSRDLLRGVMSTWGSCSLFEMAHSGRFMTFMQHACCRTTLSRIWTGARSSPSKVQAPQEQVAASDGPAPEVHSCCTPCSNSCSCCTPFSNCCSNVCSNWTSCSSCCSNICNFKASVTSISNELSPLVSSSKDQVQASKEEAATSDGPATGVHSCTQSRCSFQAPRTTFILYLLSHMLLTALLSYFILTDLAPITSSHRQSYTECVIVIWAFTFFLEEIRQIVTQHAAGLMSKLKLYLEAGWNRFDCVLYMSLMVSIILHWVLNGGAFVVARTLYSITVVMYYLRLFQFFLADKDLGPKVIMIRLMLTDLLVFGAILATMVLAYGVAVQALLFPNSSLSFSLLGDILYKPYWNIYGELFLHQTGGDVDGCSHDARIWQNATLGVPRCPEKNVAVILLLALYMMITTILLLNLLIAMFGYTFNKVQEQSEQLWGFHFYSLVYEYHHKHKLPPPFIMFSFIHLLLKRGTSTIRGQPEPEKDEFRRHFEGDQLKALIDLEKIGMEKYLQGERERTASKLRQNLPSGSRDLEWDMGRVELQEMLEKQNLEMTATRDLLQELIKMSHLKVEDLGEMANGAPVEPVHPL